MTLRFHLTPIKKAMVKKMNNKHWENVRRKEPHSLLVGMYISVATKEINIEGPQESKTRTII
jgi:hypothetical protein